ncbi:MAG: hypothetical protein HC921_11020 [Synechococcaceae cyanobacterium SM2_3_1]|nr:hypothetical protein [Synechococcaceae cyanobacterium SM2_3_1]
MNTSLLKQAWLIITCNLSEKLLGWSDPEILDYMERQIRCSLHCDMEEQQHLHTYLQQRVALIRDLV